MRKLTCGAVAALGVSLLGGSAAAQSINAAGATFPDPIYERWFQEFKQAHSSIQINYQPIGSGGGIRQLAEGTVDFGASDMPMKDDELAKMKIKPLHFPTVMGAVVIIYNLPGSPQELRFAPDVVADIFLGKITNWNDARIARDNPGVKLKAQDIVVVHRSDGSGTTFVFGDYLSKVSAEWKSKVGAASSVKWPAGIGQAKNDGVAGMVKQTTGAIGYVELVYALQNKMSYGLVKNAAGAFIKATPDSVTAAAAAAAKNMPADFRVSITNAAGAGAYPLSSFTWLLIPTKIPDAGKRKAIVDFLQWMMTTGQKDCAALGYAPLPAAVVGKEQKQLAQVQ